MEFISGLAASSGGLPTIVVYIVLWGVGLFLTALGIWYIKVLKPMLDERKELMKRDGDFYTEISKKLDSTLNIIVNDASNLTELSDRIVEQKTHLEELIQNLPTMDCCDDIESLKLIIKDMYALLNQIHYNTTNDKTTCTTGSSSRMSRQERAVLENAFKQFFKQMTGDNLDLNDLNINLDDPNSRLNRY